ncbi:MAG: amidohydrolase family protein [Blastomonas sp.]
MRQDQEGIIPSVHQYIRAFFLFLAAAIASSLGENAVARPAIVISDVQILDFSGEGPAVQPSMSVVIRDGLIEAIGPADAVAIPDGAEVIEGQGRYLMPGMADMHVHIWDEASLGAYLAHGITTVRNLSGMPVHLRLADRIAEGELAGPRLLTTGPILNSPGPNAQLNHQMVQTGEDARAAVRTQHAAGYREIKVYSNLTVEAWHGARDEAKALGMRISGHSPEGVREPGMPRDKPFNIAFIDLLDDGFTTIEHVESIVWHGLRNRYDPVAAKALARKIADSGTAVDPTLVAFHNLLRVAETRGEYLNRPGVDMMNPLLVAQEQPQYDRWSSEAIEPNREAFEFYKQVTRLFADAGVTMVAGSDAGIFTNIPGESLIDELVLLAEAGLAPLEVMRAASFNPAIVLGEEAMRGRVAAGHVADLVMLAENPLDDVTAAGKPVLVVAAGRVHDRAALDAMLDTARSPVVERTQSNLVEALTAQGIDPATLFGP